MPATQGEADLDAALLAAHAAGDRPALAAGYRAAAEMALAQGETEAGAFFLTQAYVWALDGGDAAAPALRRRLVAMGRETER